MALTSPQAASAAPMAAETTAGSVTWGQGGGRQPQLRAGNPAKGGPDDQHHHQVARGEEDRCTGEAGGDHAEREGNTDRQDQPIAGRLVVVRRIVGTHLDKRSGQQQGPVGGGHSEQAPQETPHHMGRQTGELGDPYGPRRGVGAKGTPEGTERPLVLDVGPDVCDGGARRVEQEVGRSGQILVREMLGIAVEGIPHQREQRHPDEKKRKPGPHPARSPGLGRFRSRLVRVADGRTRLL